MPKRFDIITIFPEIVRAYADESIMRRAAEKGLLKIEAHDLRDWSEGKHRTVDDKPYGGGPGMVLKFEPVAKAVKAVKGRGKSRTILLSARGRQFTQDDAKRLAGYSQLILICGRYEGVDERVSEHVADEELSIGPYVLTGGELPALVIADAVARQLPGVLGTHESLEEIHGSIPQYTIPREVKIKKGKKTVIAAVPDVLLSGDHKKIETWRRSQEKK